MASGRLQCLGDLFLPRFSEGTASGLGCSQNTPLPEAVPRRLPPAQSPPNPVSSLQEAALTSFNKTTLRPNTRLNKISRP